MTKVENCCSRETKLLKTKGKSPCPHPLGTRDAELKSSAPVDRSPLQPCPPHSPVPLLCPVLYIQLFFAPKHTMALQASGTSSHLPLQAWFLSCFTTQDRYSSSRKPSLTSGRTLWCILSALDLSCWLFLDISCLPQTRLWVSARLGARDHSTRCRHLRKTVHRGCSSLSCLVQSGCSAL